MLVCTYISRFIEITRNSIICILDSAGDLNLSIKYVPFLTLIMFNLQNFKLGAKNCVNKLLKSILKYAFYKEILLNLYIKQYLIF